MRLISEKQRAIMNKPQYKAWSAAENKAIKVVAAWLLEQGLQGNQGMIIAEEVVPMALKAKLDSISPSAPDIAIHPATALDSVVLASKKLINELDEAEELEKILARATNEEEALKHGL